MDERAAWIGLAVLALALPALLLRSRGPWLIRSAGFAAAALVLFVALDFPETRDEVVPARVVIVPTAGQDGVVAELSTKLHASGVEVAVSATAKRYGDRLAEARLEAREDGIVALLWNGSLPPAELESAPASMPSNQRCVALTPRPALPFDLEKLRVTVPSKVERNRPAEIVLEAPGLENLGADTEIEVAVSAADRVELVRRRFAVSALTASGSVRMTWTPQSVSEHAVELQVRSRRRGIEIAASGTIAVAEPRPVAVVGRQAADLAEALRTQGREVVVLTQLPADLTAYSVLVLQDRLSDAEQSRLVAFVEDGGGILLCGAQGGGALAAESEPLARLQPILRRDEPDEKRAEGPGTAPGSDPGAKPARTDLPPESPPKELPGPEPKQPPPLTRESGASDKLAGGDTSGAKLKSEKPVEVERRSIAMALVVDVSGSMSEPAQSGEGRAKIEYAKASAFATAMALLPGDQLTLISFGEFASVVLPLTPIEGFTVFETRIGSLRANQNATRVRGALDLALKQLSKSDCAVRHVVVITDGVFHDLIEAHTALRNLRAAKITTSLVQILSGGGGDNPVESQAFAQAGGGTYATPLSGEEVPRIVSTEVRAQLAKVGRHPSGEPGDGPGSLPASRSVPEPQPTSRPVPPKEPDPRPSQPPAASEPSRTWPVRALYDSRLLLPKPQNGFPALGGIVRTVAKLDSYTLLVAGAEGLPLLAFANRGLGKVGAFCSDPSSEWTLALRQDPGHPARISQWVSFLDGPTPASSPAGLGAWSVKVVPEHPSRREAEVLRRISGSEVRPASEFVAPRATIRSRSSGSARERSVLGILALLILAGAEFVVGLRAARRAQPERLRSRPSSPRPSSTAGS